MIHHSLSIYQTVSNSQLDPIRADLLLRSTPSPIQFQLTPAPLALVASNLLSHTRSLTDDAPGGLVVPETALEARYLLVVYQ